MNSCRCYSKTSAIPCNRTVVRLHRRLIKAEEKETGERRRRKDEKEEKERKELARKVSKPKEGARS